MKKESNQVKTLKKAISKSVKWIAILFAAVILLAGILFLGLQTDYTSRLFVSAINKSFLKKRGLEIKISNIEGIVPFRFSIGELEIRDGAGRWFLIKNASLSLSPADLLKGQFSFNKLHVNELRIDRKPRIKKSGQKNLPSGFKIPSIVHELSLEDLYINSIQLGRDFLGKRMNLTVRGDISKSETDDSQNLSLEINGKEGFSLSIASSVLLKKDSQYMDLSLSAEDPGKGILYNLSGVGEDFNFLMEGKGELSDWHGKLRASGSDTGELAADIDIESDRDYNLKFTGHFSPAEPLLDKNYHLLTEKGADFKLQAALDEKDISLNLLEINTVKSAAGFHGRILLSNLDSKGTFNLTAGDISMLEKFLKNRVDGSLSVDGSLEGYLLKPEIDLSYRLKRVDSRLIKASEISGSVSIDFQHESSSVETVNISGDGNIYGILLDFKESGYSKEKINYSFDLAIDAGNRLEINQLEIDSAPLYALISGKGDIGAGKLSLEGDLKVADLAGLYPQSEGPLTGSGNLNIRIDAGMSPVKVNTFIKGAYKPVPEDQFLKFPAGEDVHFEGNATFNGKEIDFSEIRIEAANAVLEAKGLYDLKGLVDLGGKITVTDLGQFSEYAEKTLKGRANGEYSINGSLSSLEMSASVDLKNFIWGNITVDSASGKITDVHTGKSDKGNILLELMNDGYRITGRSEFLLSGSQTVLQNISLSGADTEISGDIDIDMLTPSIKGKLDFSSDDLSKIAGLFGQDLKGSAFGEIILKTPLEKPGIEFSASVQNLILQKHNIESIDVSGSLSDIFDDFEFKTRASLKDYHHEKISLKTVDMNAHGEKDRFNITLKGSGTAVENLNFEASALLENSIKNKSVSVNDITAIFGDTRMKLAQPLRLTYSGDKMSVENMDIRVSSGGITGSLKYSDQKISGDFSLEKIPLNTLYLAGAPLLDGTVSGSLKLAGSPSLPDISGHLQIDGIRRKNLKNSEIPPLFIKAEYSISQESFRGKLSLGDLTGNFAIPCKFSIYPFKFAPVNTDPVSGKIKGEFKLAVIPALFEINNYTITGTLDTDLSLGGTYDSLSISGKSELSKGKYVNPGMGLMFNNIQADITAENSEIVLHSLKADDGRNGTVTGNGTIDIDMNTLRDLPYKLDMKFKNMQLIDNDRLNAVLGGNAQVSGSVGRHKITGNLTLEKGQFHIPEKLPVEVTEIEIKEINQKKEGLPEETVDSPVRTRVKFDITVKSPGRMYINGRGLDSEWKGNVKLEGSLDEPIVTGKLSLVRGKYDFLSKPFNLTDGQVNFSGNSPPDPYFDVTGKFVNSSITAYINLKGSIKNPVLSISSEPVLPQDEVLARVLFGRQVSQITPLQALQLAAALRGMLGGKKGFDPLEYTRNLIGIDRLEVKQSQSDPDETALSAGKYLNEDIYIEVEKGISAESGKASVTWELTPHVTVETEVGEDSEKGMELNWKYDY